MIDRDQAVRLFRQILAEQGDRLSSECVSSLLSAIDALDWSRAERVSYVIDGSIPTYFLYVDAVGRLRVP